MPARVHALLVVRPDGRIPAAHHLRRTLRALDEQTRKPDALTIVVCGADPGVTEAAAASGAESVITTSGGTGFAAALALATHRVEADAVWLLAQDTAPQPEALHRLVGALELAPSVAFVAPKLVRWDDATEIVSLGVGMTRLGRAVGLSDGELDQGQHDAEEDVLGSDVRGILVRSDAWHELGGLDAALRGADEGLDLGVRARLAGARVSLVPGALVAVAGDGVAGPPAPVTRRSRRRRAFAARTAQLHRRLAYAHALALPFVWLALVPLVVWRTGVLLVRKTPSLIWPEWAATLVAFFRPAAVVRSRRRIRRARRASWSQLAPLRVSHAELRQRFDDDPDVPTGDAAPQRGELRFFSGGAAWLVLAALTASVAAFPALLAWPVLGGGALEPLRSTLSQLWGDVAYGRRALGLDTIAPADPFAAVIAVLGSAWPVEPSRVLVVLWVLALPVAALGGWFAATRVTDRAVLRIAGGVVWALAPTFLAALTQGRPAAVVLHLLLPWLLYAGSVAHRSWVASGAASLLLAAVVACGPSLAPALAVLWAVTLLLTIVVRAGRGAARVIWVAVPAIALAVPLVWRQLRLGTPLAVLADPGMPWAGPQVAADSAGRALLAAGFPTTDPGGWTAFLADAPTWWVPLLAAPIALLALVAPLTQRWAAGTALLVVAALGIGTAFAAVGVSVSFAQSQPVALWPGSGLSLAWLGALGGALVTLDAGIAPRLRAARAAAAVTVVAAIAVLSVPSLTAFARDQTLLQNGPRSTLPAYVAAEGRDDPDVGTVVLTPQNSGGVAASVVWGGSETLGSQSTVVATRTEASDTDAQLAALTADLVTSTTGDAVDRLVRAGVSFVLLAPAAVPESDAARALRLQAQTSLDQRDGLDSVGDTSKGALWRVEPDADPRPALSAADARRAGWIGGVQLAVAAIALLLAIPTAGTRSAARRTSRVVGPYWQEGR
ncbi:glycosyltransferase [Microbacterium ulmi]|uniref:Glycosyltransferase family 2 protein n=1 Tax=Microbacterium ulmi TaxID=179095 RepID=A0A7Y2M098_9MICO|nr:glycosyltransferase [Microbacterium ulmi]NII70381.1 GT2 family glycosyltransferase [Microbacterium ulmi]NNH03429.1 glycosyltransferase family 2 protein [Microbacterium ulmi]